MTVVKTCEGPLLNVLSIMMKKKLLLMNISMSRLPCKTILFRAPHHKPLYIADSPYTGRTPVFTKFPLMGNVHQKHDRYFAKRIAQNHLILTSGKIKFLIIFD